MAESVQKHIRTQLIKLRQEADPYGATVQLRKNSGSHFQFFIRDRNDRKMQLQSCASDDPRAFKNNRGILRRWLRQGGDPLPAERPTPTPQPTTAQAPATNAFEKMLRVPEEPTRQPLVLPKRLTDILVDREAMFEEREALLDEQEQLLARREELSRRQAVLNRRLITELVGLLQGMPDLPDLEPEAPAEVAEEAGAAPEEPVAAPKEEVTEEASEPAAESVTSVPAMFRRDHHNPALQIAVELAQAHGGIVVTSTVARELIGRGLFDNAQYHVARQSASYVVKESGMFRRMAKRGRYRFLSDPSERSAPASEASAPMPETEPVASTPVITRPFTKPVYNQLLEIFVDAAENGNGVIDRTAMRPQLEAKGLVPPGKAGTDLMNRVLKESGRFELVSRGVQRLLSFRPKRKTAKDPRRPFRLDRLNDMLQIAVELAEENNDHLLETAAARSAMEDAGLIDSYSVAGNKGGIDLNYVLRNSRRFEKATKGTWQLLPPPPPDFPVAVPAE